MLRIGIGIGGTGGRRLSYPNTMKFDQYHNLYVADSGNNRIQRFDLIHNGCWFNVEDKQLKYFALMQFLSNILLLLTITLF